MKFENLCQGRILVQIFVDGLAGVETVVEGGTIVDIHGPPLQQGMFLTVHGSMTAMDLCEKELPDVIYVGNEPVTKFLATLGGQLCAVVVKPYYQVRAERQSR